MPVPHPPPSRRRRLVTAILAIAGACTVWFVAHATKPGRHLPLAWQSLQKATTLVAAVVTAQPAGATTLPYTVYVGQMALYGPKPQRLDVATVSLDWRATDPFLLVSGDRYPLIDPVQEGTELRFAIQDLVGRKGRWEIHLRIGTGTLAGTVTAPTDPLLGGYMLVGQTATRNLIPPPPVPPRITWGR
jgi:hypothetical protein